MAFFNRDPQFDSVQFTLPIKRSDGRYFIGASFENNDLMCLFGPNMKFKNDITSDDTEVELLIKDENVTDFLSKADKMLVAMCKENKNQWFPGASDGTSAGITDEWLDDAFTKSLREKKHSSSVKLMVSKKLLAYGPAKEELQVTDITKDRDVSVIVQLAGLWFKKTSFGITWLLKQVKVQNNPKSNTSKCMFEEDEVDIELDNVFPDE